MVAKMSQGVKQSQIKVTFHILDGDHCRVKVQFNCSGFIQTPSDLLWITWLNVCIKQQVKPVKRAWTKFSDKALMMWEEPSQSMKRERWLSSIHFLNCATVMNRMQNNMVENKPCESSTTVLWLSPQWLPCCSIVLSCGWMRQRAAQRRLCYVLHAASAPAPSALETHQQPDMLIVAPGPQLILPITSCNALSMPPPALLLLDPVLSVCSTGKTDVKQRLSATKYNWVYFCWWSSSPCYYL